MATQFLLIFVHKRIYIALFFCNFLANAKAKIKFTLKIVKKKNDRNFFEIKSNKIQLEFGAVKLNFSNMFNGNKEMGKH